MRGLFAGRYRLIKPLGSGAQGLALLVADTLRQDAPAVLKLGRSGQEARDGTLAEFEALRMLNTPFIAPVLTLGFAGPRDLNLVAQMDPARSLHIGDQTRAYLVRAWVDGPDLLTWAHQRLTQPHGHNAICSALTKLTDAVAALHNANLVHGDLKPEHILVPSGEHGPRPMLIDFGLSTADQHTNTGGTPGYLAPERLRGTPAHFASDRFALGVIFTQALTGRRLRVPAAATKDDLCRPLLHANLPERLLQAIRRLLDADPQQRPDLRSVRAALLPPSAAVGGGWQPTGAARPPFLGQRRRNQIQTLLERAVTPHRLPPIVLLVGPRGSGRSRMLRQIGWELQRTGRPALELFAGVQPWQRLANLGPQLASLSERPFTMPSQLARPERSRWLHDLSDALVQALPSSPVALLWDDIGQNSLEGLETIETTVMALERAQGNLRLWASTTPETLTGLRPLFASAGFEVIELHPLTRHDLDDLLGTEHHGGQLSPGQLDRLWRLTQGSVAQLAAWMARDRHSIAQPNADSALEALIIALASLYPGGVTVDEAITAATRLGHTPASVQETFNHCLATRRIQDTHPKGDNGQHAYTAAFVPLAHLTEELQHHLGQLLSTLDTETHPHLSVMSAALQGDERRLLSAWQTHRHNLKAHHGHALVLTLLETALLTSADALILEDFVQTALEAGQHRMGTQAIARLLEQPNPIHGHQHLQVARLRLAFAAGKVPDTLLDGLPQTLTPIELGHVANIRAQLELRRSRFPEAARWAERGLQALNQLSAPGTTELRAQLQVTDAAAQAMQGADPQHQQLEDLQRALKLEGAAPRARARCHAMQAVIAYMRGDLDLAAESYRAGLEVVEQEGLDVERPVYLLNLGTAYERQGRLSMARQYYDQGGRACLPTTRSTTRALLLANRANVDIKLGRPWEARELLAAAGRIARETGLTFVTQFVEQLEADADAEEGHMDAAEAVYARCAQTFAKLGDKRHACELFIKAGLAAARAGHTQVARRHLLQTTDADEFADLKRRAALLRAELSMSRGGVERLAGVDQYLRVLQDALEARDDLTVLTQARWLTRRLASTSEPIDPLLHKELASLVGKAWRRVALSLDPGLRRDMARHMELAHLIDLGTQPEPTTSPRLATTIGHEPTLLSNTTKQITAPVRPLLGTHESAGRPRFAPRTMPDEVDRQAAQADIAEKFFRMLSLGRRIIGETDLERLIPSALDIAISLSGAERGFLLLRQKNGEPLQAAFSRDIDGRPIDAAALEISASIARQAAEEGRAIVTEDATADARFGQAASVHRLKLTSILCVPIRDRDRILGCLYLDHRDAPGIFDGHVPRMMTSYADQVALALVSARRMADLARERDELKTARKQIEALLAEKEELLMDLETRCRTLEADLARERNQTALRYDYDHIVAQAPAMRRVLGQVDRVVDTNIPVVIQGESGTGKEVIAKAIHFNGRRKTSPFVAVNCGALAETLLESELFGHKKGAFTGATTDRKGLFEAASGGTLFLDEVGEMSLTMQVKLLRALQERRIRPVGAIKELSVDVRIVAATNRDLQQMVREGTFREDLYYRLATLVLRLPPLRDRREDIPLLVRHILTRTCAESGLDVPQVTGQAVSTLMQHRWPGNIRQLENVIRAATVLSDTHITPETLLHLLPTNLPLTTHTTTRPPRPPSPAHPRSSAPGRPPKCSAEQVNEAMRLNNNNRTAAARMLGVSLRTLQRYLSQQR
mgnify:CR=1 FL=1